MCLYDAGNFNDQLLLRLEGTMSEAELHILKAHMPTFVASRPVRLVRANAALQSAQPVCSPP